MQVIKTIVVASILFLLLVVIKLWYADTIFAKGSHTSDSDNPGLAYDFLNRASIINQAEPLYRSELAYVAAVSAASLPEVGEATLSGELKDQSLSLTKKILEDSPNNTSFWRTAIRTYFALSSLDKIYTDKTLETIDHTIELAPTDAKLYYNKAVILGSQKRVDEAISTLKKATELKANYRDAYYGLALFYIDKKDFPDAKTNLEKVLQLIPNDPEALEKLTEMNKQ